MVEATIPEDKAVGGGGSGTAKPSSATSGAAVDKEDIGTTLREKLHKRASIMGFLGEGNATARDNNKTYFQMLDRPTDMFVPIELTRKWRRHLVYGKREGRDLIALFTGRYAALTTMSTLLLGTEVGILFSPSEPAQKMRDALYEKHHDIEFWAGFSLLLNIGVSITALIAILTAWALNAVISPNNAHILLRSSFWLHAASLPAQLALTAIYLFVVSLCLFFFVIANWVIALPVMLLFVAGNAYVISLYSAAGRMLMLSGAIGDERVVERDIEYELTPDQLTQVLLGKALLAKEAHIPPREQYRMKYQEQLDVLEEGGSLKLEELRLPQSEYLGEEYSTMDDGIAVEMGTFGAGNKED